MRIAPRSLTCNRTETESKPDIPHSAINHGRIPCKPNNTLARLSDLVDYEVAHGQPDVRGWDVKTADNEVCGTVEDLVIDTAAMQVRYLDVRLDRETPESKQGSHVLISLGDARLDDHNDDVVLSGQR